MPDVDDTVKFGDARDGLMQRAKAAGIETQVEYWEGTLGADFEGNKRLYIYLPNGRKKYRVMASEPFAASIADTNFEYVHILGKYDAIFDCNNNSIEAVISPVSGGTRATSRFLRLPGIHFYKRSEDQGEYETFPGGYGELPAREAHAMTPDSKYTWRLPIDVAEQRVNVEISPVSKNASVLLSGVHASSPSLKISRYSYETHDKCVEYLEQVASSLFFDIDLRFSTGYTLCRQTSRDVRVRRSPSEDERPIAVPNVRYSVPATTIYFYARSVGNSLNRYLAYYQAIEYFFPSFFNREIIERLRNKLRDPRFNSSFDTDIQQLIEVQ